MHNWIDGPPGPGLAAGLRAATAVVHADLERRLAAILRPATTFEYATCLAAHYAAFLALEPPLAGFDGWRGAGIEVHAHQRLPHLRADLSALGVDFTRVAAPIVPPPAGFPAAVGALYVLEGSSLGGHVILREAAAKLGGAIRGATAFFGGVPGRPSWPAFKSRLDAFGAATPAAVPEVVAGAEAAFGVFASVLVRAEARF